MALQEFSGNAVAATLNGSITSGATSCVISDGTGWPTGATAPFVATFGKGTATEEKILCSTRSGTTLNFSTRGFDGTTPAAHSAGDTVIHSVSAVVMAEASAHVNTTTRDDHTQYAKKASNLSDLSNVATARTNLGAQASDADLTAIAALVSAADKLPYATGAQAWALTTLTAFARTLLDDADAATMRATLGAVIGTNVQAWDTDLDALAGLTYAADKIAYFTGAHAAATTTLSSFMRTLLDDADAATALGTLGLTSAWTTYTPTNSGITVGNGTQSAAYRLVGKTCHVRWNLVWGSTTSYVAAPKFGLPFAAVATQVGSALCKDVSAGNEYPSTCYVLDTSPSLGNFATEGHTTVGGATPFGWATTDSLTAQLTYETT